MESNNKLIEAFKELKSASFISVNNYQSKTTGELANHVININISAENAKKNDLDTLRNCKKSDLLTISENTKISIEILKEAFTELIINAEKNLSTNKDEHTNQSKGQTDAYFHLTPAIKVNKNTSEIHVFGQAIDKKVLVKGIYKEVKSSDKTIAKNAIKKHLKLRSDKFRTFICDNINNIKINNQIINL